MNPRPHILDAAQASRSVMDSASGNMTGQYGRANRQLCISETANPDLIAGGSSQPSPGGAANSRWQGLSESLDCDS